MREGLAAAVLLGTLALTGPVRAAAPAAPDAAPGTAPGTAIERGQKLFVADGCYECHGTKGQGSAVGARLAPEPPALEVIQAYVRDPGGQMPAYAAKVVDDEALADIRAYLASIRKPDAPLLATLR